MEESGVEHNSIEAALEQEVRVVQFPLPSTQVQALLDAQPLQAHRSKAEQVHAMKRVEPSVAREAGASRSM